MGERLLQLYAESVITQSIITVIVVGVLAWRYAHGYEVSPELLAIANLIIGYYFGAKAQQAAVTAVKRRKEGIDG